METCVTASEAGSMLQAKPLTACRLPCKISTLPAGRVRLRAFLRYGSRGFRVHGSSRLMAIPSLQMNCQASCLLEPRVGLQGEGFHGRVDYFLHPCTHSIYIYVYIYTYMYVHTFLHICIYTSTCRWIYVCTSIYIIYIYTHTSVCLGAVEASVRFLSGKTASRQRSPKPKNITAPPKLT